jgi:hypothetical protein
MYAWPQGGHHIMGKALLHTRHDIVTQRHNGIITITYNLINLASNQYNWPQSTQCALVKTSEIDLDPIEVPRQPQDDHESRSQTSKAWRIKTKSTHNNYQPMAEKADMHHPPPNP